MEMLIGNIWDFCSRWDWLVVPTNIGWNHRGEAVMGRGIAGQAAKLFPDLKVIYGDICLRHRAATPCCTLQCKTRSGAVRGLIMFPTKPLNERSPQLSWQSDASLELIERSLRELQQLAAGRETWLKQGGRVLVPMVGHGHGRLEERDILPLLCKYLIEPFFILVKRSSEHGINAPRGQR